jgi:hypothetical protein
MSNALVEVVALLATTGSPRFAVTIIEDDSETRHETTLRETDLQRFGKGASAEALVTAAFRFLLDREPKEAILARFDISVIARYFPEFDQEIGRYLSAHAR